MDKIDVLLLNLPTGTWYKKKLAEGNSMPPLGIMYIAAYLKQKGYSVRLLDMAVENMKEQEFFSYISRWSPKIIGMSTYSESWKAQIILCKKIKDKFPNTIIAAGGAFATFCREQMLKESLTDYIFLGEGEFVFGEFCDSILRNQGEVKRIKGLCYVENGEVICNKEYQRIHNLDELPFPDRSLINLDKYVLPFTISTSRGCPGQTLSKAQDLYNKYKANILFAITTPYPGTELREKLEEYGAKLLINDDSQLQVERPSMQIKNLTVNQVRKYYDLAQHMFKLRDISE